MRLLSSITLVTVLKQVNGLETSVHYFLLSWRFEVEKEVEACPVDSYRKLFLLWCWYDTLLFQDVSFRHFFCYLLFGDSCVGKLRTSLSLLGCVLTGIPAFCSSEILPFCALFPILTVDDILSSASLLSKTGFISVSASEIVCLCLNCVKIWSLLVILPINFFSNSQNKDVVFQVALGLLRRHSCNGT